MNGAEPPIYFAKSPDANGHSETVAEHLEKVAGMAGIFGKETGQQNAARVAGQVHDFGKYSRAFQEVLVGTRHGVDTLFRARRSSIGRARSGCAPLSRRSTATTMVCALWRP